MKLINKIITTAVLPLAMAGMMASCEDACTNCSCDNFKITSIVSGDSLQQLNELYSDQVVVIKGVGLSSVHDVYLVDSTGAQYSVELNPTFVTDNNIVITMSSDAALVSTEKVLVVSNYGCRNEYAIKKPVSAPSIKLFYCEFVPDGDTLRVYGNAFLNNPEMKDTLKVWFQSMDGATIVKADSFVIDHDNTELRIKVPVGVADNSYLYVQNNHGVSVSPMLFRDTRNIFLDFDEEIASNLRGSMIPLI